MTLYKKKTSLIKGIIISVPDVFLNISNNVKMTVQINI